MIEQEAAELKLDMMQEEEWSQMNKDLNKIPADILEAYQKAKGAMRALENRDDPERFGFCLRTMYAFIGNARQKCQDFHKHIDLLKKDSNAYIQIAKKLGEKGYVFDENQALQKVNALESHIQDFFKRLNSERVREEIIFYQNRGSLQRVYETLSSVSVNLSKLGQEIESFRSDMNFLRKFLLEEQQRIRSHIIMLQEIAN
jgi:hypothetical protein